MIQSSYFLRPRDPHARHVWNSRLSSLFVQVLVTVPLKSFNNWNHPRCSPPHRVHCAVSIQKATRCISHYQPMHDESDEPPAGTKWLYDHGQYHTQCIQGRSSQKSSSGQFLAVHRNREVRAECGVYVASRPTTHNTSHLFLC